MIEVDQTYQFTEDWWTPHIPLWERMVLPLLKERQRFLEIGCFEGRASCWMLEHGLTSTGELFCIDTFEGSPEFATLPKEHVSNVKERFQHNTVLARRPEQYVRLLEGSSVEALAQLLNEQGNEPTFDLIYVDAGHDVTSTLTDSVMAWPLLKSGGVMVWDDYTWNLNLDVQSRPKFAIDTFTTIWNPYLNHIAVGRQYVIQKK